MRAAGAVVKDHFEQGHFEREHFEQDPLRTQKSLLRIVGPGSWARPSSATIFIDLAIIDLAIPFLELLPLRL
jgi:hypothetical protein